ncbi:grpE protein homolog, mitochondrial [Drosophila subobscura]|uniref:grpE protein homolog, mitochondrial n=1 Tax=Drosophila subobscura TaxID=7241 RepID=UPI00155A66FB|nr:grpE protein homolog, mitochondrial [Drosophila subobscura]
MTSRAGLSMLVFGRSLSQFRAVVSARQSRTLRQATTALGNGRLYSTEKQPEEAAAAEQNAATQEVERLTKELAESKDKYMRALADGENMRTRLNKQISDAKIFAIQSFCKDLLEVADTLGHAIKAVPKDKLGDNTDLKSLYEGLTMTRASLLQVFKRNGLEAVDPINQKFDPNLHEALFQKEDKTVEANTVVEVTKLGYKLHERCVRPALVGVSKC